MTCRIYTARLGSRWEDELPVTRFSVLHPVGRVFAPSEQLVVTTAERHKGSLDEATWGAFAMAYVSEMRASYRMHRAVWNEVLARESVTFTCMCQEHRACHRTLLAGILGKLGAEVCGERVREADAA